MTPLPRLNITGQNQDSTELTLNGAAFRQIRADIVACRLEPSEHLRIERLRGRYGVGAGPIREALMRLEAEGLVTLEQNKGFRVSAVSVEHLSDLMKMRAEIEAVALRLSIENGGIEWEADLLGAFHRLAYRNKVERINNTEVNAAWFREHRDFHSALVSACGSPTLISIRDNLFAQAERYIALSIKSKIVLRDDTAEHEQLMQAALARNVARATKLLTLHIEKTAQKVAKSLTGTVRPIKRRATT